MTCGYSIRRRLKSAFCPYGVRSFGACLVNETYVKVAGRWTYLYRAIDQHGQVIDVLLSQRRDLAAARRFFHQRAARGHDPGRRHH